MQYLLKQARFKVLEDVEPLDQSERYFSRRRDGFQIAGEGAGI